jgi:hypothetical protein
MKTPLAGTDFMAADPWYTSDDTPGDVSMKHFSIARELGPNGLVTFIKQARRYGSFVLQAPVDDPPDWWKGTIDASLDLDLSVCVVRTPHCVIRPHPTGKCIALG